MRYYRGFIQLVLLTGALLSGGCLSVHLRTANEYYQQFAYASAANEYEYVLSRKTDRDAVFNIADCYRQMGNPVKTEYWYKKAIKLNSGKPECYLYLGEALMKNGNYTEAKTSLLKYLDLNKNDSKAIRMIMSCDSMGLFYRDTTLYTVSSLKINTPRDNFFAPAFYKSGIVFLSDRNEKGLSKTISDGTGRRFLDLFSVKKTDRGNWLEIEPLRGDVNGKFNEGPVVFSNNFSTMYFTRNNYISNRAEKNSRNVNVLKIFRADAVDGEWKLKGPMYFNSDDYSVGHPALNSAGTVMVFSSDMPWGYGGSDLYMVRWEGGERWSNPVNLGPNVNTEGNELFPFMMNDSVLFFASDGQMGMGGLDIFEAHSESGTWSKPDNLGYPINSPQDDFSFICDSTGLAGYFSSSRNGNTDKIYSFTKHPPQLLLELKISEMQTGVPVSQAKVKVTTDNGKDTTFVTNASGKILMSVQPGHNYSFKCDHPDFFMISTQASTIGRRFSETLEVPVEMRRIQLNKSYVWQGVAFKKKDFQLKLTSGEALQRLTTLLKDNPRLLVEIGSYTDSRNSDADNLQLTQQRAELVVNYLIGQCIPASRLIAKGYGETKLLNKCTNGLLCIEEEHEINNRIEINIRSISKETSLQ